MKMPLACLACLVALAGAASAEPPGPAREDSFALIRGMLDSASPGDDFYRSQGAVDVLAEGKSAQFKVEIDPDAENTIVGACDSNCGDIDLFVYEEGGELIDSDDGAGDQPSVALGSSGRKIVVVKVEMATCGDDPCAYGVAVYEKQPGKLSVDAQIKALLDVLP